MKVLIDEATRTLQTLQQSEPWLQVPGPQKGSVTSLQCTTVQATLGGDQQVNMPLSRTGVIIGEQSEPIVRMGLLARALKCSIS